MSTTHCPNCNNKISGIFATAGLIEKKKTDFINLFHDQKSEAHCTGCGEMLYEKYKAEGRIRIKEIQDNIEKLINTVPIVTIHNPHDWDYEVLSIVTAQSVTGTGIMSEISSAFADIFGAQSNSLSSKIEAGENICMNSLRLKTAKLGGNAIIASDIDYAEVGGAKGMLMVCMTGTAIKLKNFDTIREKDASKLNELSELLHKHNQLTEIYK